MKKKKIWLNIWLNKTRGLFLIWKKRKIKSDFFTFSLVSPYICLGERFVYTEVSNFAIFMDYVFWFHSFRNERNMYLTFLAYETRVLSSLIFDNLLNFKRKLKTQVCPNFTILQLILKFHYNLSHRLIKKMKNAAYHLHILVMRINTKQSHSV